MARPAKDPWKPLTRWCLGLLGWLVLFGVAHSDVWRDVRAQGRHVTPAAIESARARWETLSPHEQARLRRRFEELQKLDDTQRTEFQARTERRRREEARVRRQLTAEERSRLKRLSPRQRQEVIAELVDQERRDKGRRIESKLPLAMREWLRNAPPKQRQARLEAFKAQTRGRISARAVEGLAKALGYGKAEIKRLERLPMDQRMASVMYLSKQLTAKQLQELGLPRGMTEESWSELEALSPEEFLREVWQLQNQGILSGVIGVGQASRSDARQARRRVAGEIRRAMRIQPDQLLEFSGLPRPERRRRITQLRRTRAMEALRRHAIFKPEQLEALAQLDDEALLERVRSLLDESLERPRRNREARR